MISLTEIKNILQNQNPDFLEDLARRSQEMTQQYFGRTMSLYAPLYLSNFCSSYCTYCGFHNHHRIKRFKLTPEQIAQEMSFIADQRIENILLLTGESYQATPLPYLREAVQIAKKYFSSISLEVHPMDEKDYHHLFFEGVDGLTIYQETYDRDRYREVHLSGKKADYDYRYGACERAAEAGFRYISLGILLGLGNLERDLLGLYEHLRYMEKHFPGVEYSVSFPRLRSIRGKNFAVCDVDDTTFIKIICLTRLLFPRVGINLSTREKPGLRNHAMELGVTRVSAGSKTSVGGYRIIPPEEQDPQFDVEDNRSVEEMIDALKQKNFDPVLTDWRRIDLK